MSDTLLIGIATVISSIIATVVNGVINYLLKRPKANADGSAVGEQARIAAETANEMIFSRQSEAYQKSQENLSALEERFNLFKMRFETLEDTLEEERKINKELLESERKKSLALAEGLESEKIKSRRLLVLLNQETTKRKELEQEVTKLESRIAALEELNKKLKTMIEEENGEI